MGAHRLGRARTALPELLNVRITKTTKDRLCHTGAPPFRQAEVHRIGFAGGQDELFGRCGSIVLYDVTNTKFEGLCASNPKAKHGKKKQKRNDCRQVAVGMAFDERGLPLAHEVFEGNISDTKTLVHLPDRLHLGLPGEDGREKPMVILDPGLAYHLLCCVRERLRAKGDSRDWKTLRRPLSTHGLLTTRPPLEDGRVLHIRKASIPGAHQAKVFQKLGINWKAEVPPQKRFVKS